MSEQSGFDVHCFDSWHGVDVIPPCEVSGSFLLAHRGQYANYVSNGWWDKERQIWLTKPHGLPVLDPVYAWTCFPQAPTPELFNSDDGVIQLDICDVVHNTEASE